MADQPIVQQPVSNNPNQFAQPPAGFGQQQSNMGYGGFGQQQPNMGYGGFGQQQMNTGFGQQQPNMGYGGGGFGQQQQMNMGFGQQQMNMGFGQPQNSFQQGSQLMAVPPPMMDPPPPVPGVPIGLEQLLPLNGVFVKQQPEMLEVMLRVETPNRYDVITGNGQRIYLAAETTPPNRMYGANRPFTIDIVDSFGRRVLYLSRVDSGCCTKADMFVSLGDGTKLGEVIQTKCCKAEFRITDSTDNTIMLITGPSDAGCCFLHAADFPISTANKEKAPCGVIRKTFSGQIQEYISDADTFGVEFPAEIDIRWKALMFAAVFLIDFGFFERTPIRESHYGHGRHGRY